MNIVMDAQVECTDGPCGRCTQILLNPRIARATHLVITENDPPHIQRLVPIERLLKSDAAWIHLRCSRAELASMEEFVRREQVQVSVPPAYWPGEYTMEPIFLSPTAEVTVEHLRVPSGDVALHHHMRVDATDGLVGQVNEYRVDAMNGRLTHLILSEGHLWSKKQVLIPIWSIDHITEDAVHLKFSRRYLGGLPRIPACDNSSGVV